MGLKRLVIRFYSATIKTFRIGKTILSVGDIARVEEGSCIGRMIGQPDVELGFGGLPVGLDNGRFGSGHLQRDGDGGRLSGLLGGYLG